MEFYAKSLWRSRSGFALGRSAAITFSTAKAAGALAFILPILLLFQYVNDYLCGAELAVQWRSREYKIIIRLYFFWNSPILAKSISGMYE